MVIIFILFFLVFTHPVFAIPDVQITDFSSNSNPEWIQLTNNTSNSINLENWTFEDESKTSKSINICLSPNSNQILEYSYIDNSDWLNNSKSVGDTYTDIIYLFNSSKILIHQFPYINGVDKPKPESTNTCVVTPTPIPTTIPTNIPTVTPTPTLSPTPTPTKTPTPTITPTLTNTPTPTIKITPTAIPTDRNLYKLDESATASAVFTPTDETSYYITPTISATPISSSLVLGQTTTAKKKYLPLIFIVSGGSLFVSPLLIDKFKKK